LRGKPLRRSELPVPAVSLTVNLVCRDCNQGWLNNLEDSVEPAIPGSPQPGAFVPDLAEELGLWMVTRALLRTCLEASEDRAPRHLFRHVYQHRTPPPGTKVHLGITNAYMYPAGRYSWGHVLDAESREAGYLGFVTYGLGSGFFEVGLSGGDPYGREQITRVMSSKHRARPGAYKWVVPPERGSFLTQEVPPDEIHYPMGLLWDHRDVSENHEAPPPAT
jgi:hypothetical protein